MRYERMDLPKLRTSLPPAINLITSKVKTVLQRRPQQREKISDDWEIVQKELDITGCGDEFSSIVDNAMMKEPMPESPAALDEGPVQDLGEIVRAYRFTRTACTP